MRHLTSLKLNFSVGCTMLIDKSALKSISLGGISSNMLLDDARGFGLIDYNAKVNQVSIVFKADTLMGIKYGDGNLRDRLLSKKDIKSIELFYSGGDHEYYDVPVQWSADSENLLQEAHQEWTGLVFIYIGERES